MADEIIDQQAGLPIAAPVALELARLTAIFATADASEGLTASDRKPPVHQAA